MTNEISAHKDKQKRRMKLIGQEVSAIATTHRRGEYKYI